MQRKKILLIVAAAVLVTGAAVARYATLKTWALSCVMEKPFGYRKSLFIEERFFGGFAGETQFSDIIDGYKHRGALWLETKIYDFKIDSISYRMHSGMYAYKMQEFEKPLGKGRLEYYECYSTSPSLR